MVACVLSDSQRAQGEIAPVTGDWVEIGDTEGLGTVIARVLPRRTAVSRRDPAEKDLEQVLASNVDVVAAVLGLDRPVQAGWLERLLVMAIDSGAEPLIVLTKADEADVDTPAFSIVEAVAGSVPVIVTSVVDRTGLDELLARIGAERTLALVGESGVGKSSIVNALVGEERLEVGEVRASDAEGRHTTTARELIRLPGDAGLILDTPGIRTLGLWEAEHALDLVFGDLVELAEQCRFRDCAHRGEPGCAVQAAIDTGDLPAMRVRLSSNSSTNSTISGSGKRSGPGGRRVAGAGVVRSTGARPRPGQGRVGRSCRSRFGEFGDDTDRLRQFVMGECRFPVDSEIVERRWCARIGGHDDGHTDLSHDRIRARNKRDFGHARMVEQDALDLHRIDVVATADEHLFHPSSQPEDAVVVAGGEVACAEPAVDERLRRARRVVPVARHHCR